MEGMRTGEGGGAAFARVEAVLRERLADGTYPRGGLLPPQRELAQELGVSRDTMQRVLRKLVGDGFIETRQGSGSRVIGTPVTVGVPAPGGGSVRLDSVIRSAFEKPQVALDVFTLSFESPDVHIRLQMERIREGEIAPERVALRILLPSEKVTLPYPRPGAGAEDPRLHERLQERLQDISRSRIRLLEMEVAELRSGRGDAVSLEVRRTPLHPAFKLYLINGAEALFAPYEVIERRIPLEGGEEVDALDVRGLGATLTRHVRTEEPLSTGSVFVDSMQAWFNSVWNRLSS